MITNTTPFCCGRLLVAALTIPCAMQAQDGPTIGILNIEGRGVLPDAQALGSMVRIEMEKVRRYDVLDWHDARDVLGRNGMDLNNCFGKSCVLEAGRLLNADKMLLGSVERYGERIAITLKVADVGTGSIERSNTSEYENIQKEIQRMIEVSVKRLVGQEPDTRLTENLAAYDKPIESMVPKANLSGPRVGCFVTTGIAGERMTGDTRYGGLGMNTVSSMIGWQQEVSYINSGNFQALLEFLFTGAGLESGRFIPAFSMLTGFRMNKQGWEIALGPTVRFVRMAEGTYNVDENGKYDAVTDWRRTSDWMAENGTSLPEQYKVYNIDSRGAPTANFGLVLAAGKTFRSGQLNIPVNVYTVPRKDGTVYGATVGFNVFRAKR